MIVRGDVTSFSEIADAAERVIVQCVRWSSAGGSTTDFSTLALAMSLYLLVYIENAIPLPGTHSGNKGK